jgi:hypothetical protein
MTKKTEKKKADRPKTHSSISVSNKIVCEDEACIGKGVDQRDAPNGRAARQDTSRGKLQRPGTSMSIGGEDACSDESCIGKK